LKHRAKIAIPITTNMMTSIRNAALDAIITMEQGMAPLVLSISTETSGLEVCGRCILGGASHGLKRNEIQDGAIGTSFKTSGDAHTGISCVQENSPMSEQRIETAESNSE
jgi:hypothetical protein